MSDEEKKSSKETIQIPTLDLSNDDLDAAISNVSMTKEDTRDQEEKNECSKCKNENLKPGEKLQTDQAGNLYCPTCLANAKKELLQGSSISKKKENMVKKEKSPAKKASSTKGKGKASQKTYADPATIQQKQPPLQRNIVETRLDNDVENDIAEIIQEHSSDLIKTISDAEKDLQKYFSDKDLTSLKKAVEFPPLCNFMYVVFRFLKKLIHIDHPLAKEFTLDLDIDKEASHSSFLRPFMPLFLYSFYIKHSDVLEYYLDLAIVVAIDLEQMIKRAAKWDRRTERWCATVQAFLGEFQTRNNTFFSKFEMISNSPIELQKLFAGFSINLSKLASIERTINTDARSQFDKAYQALPDKDKVEKITELFDTSYTSSLQEDTKKELFNNLVGDKETKAKAEDLILLYARMDNEVKSKFMKLLRPQLMPDEIDALVPELAKYRGRIFAE